MRPLSFLRRNPLLVLGAFVVTFAVWVLSDLTDRSRVPSAQAPGNGLPNGNVKLVRPLPVPAGEVVAVEPARLTPQGTAQALPKLKPGMTRAEVEELVGAPAVGSISPATVQDGRVTYHTQYEADLGPLPTVRPVGRVRHTLQPSPPRALVTLEFDATKPGHPLVGVHYPDPLF
ncbi:MAG TPA: hypothetical protein VGE74_14660 [Gemmata sp.]